MASMSKAKLVENLNTYGLGYSKEELHNYVVDIFSLMEDALCQNEDISLPNFGVLEVVDKVARPARNPKTKEEVVIARRKGIRFRPAPALNKQINKETKHD